MSLPSSIAEVEPAGDVIVIGAGIAGLAAALALAPRRVTLITAGAPGEGGSSSWAQGGLAAAMGADDDPTLHAEDTVAAGAGLCDAAAVDILCTEGPAAVEHLRHMGVPFDSHPDGRLRLGLEAAHQRHRIVHVGGDEAGATIMRVLAAAALTAEHISVRAGHVALRLLRTAHGAVTGVQCHDTAGGQLRSFAAPVTILATGGAGGLFAVTTNPLLAQGHGLCLAHAAGATLRDLEFVQFHPTGIDIGRDPAPLATEALRGDGATLIDASGARFMADLHPDAELAPRDVVARGVALAIATTGRAYLDARAAIGARFAQRYPTVYAACMAAGLDPAIRPIPVAPAAHYHMGGVRTDLDGQTDVHGLYAIGEVASTGVHGANRLASNSLLEALVFATRAARAILATQVTATGRPDTMPLLSLPAAPAQGFLAVRAEMSRACGLLRDRAGLCALIARLDRAPIATIGDRLAIDACTLIASAALAREESRGAHQRTDFPEAGLPAHQDVSGTARVFAPLDHPTTPMPRRAGAGVAGTPARFLAPCPSQP